MNNTLISEVAFWESQFPNHPLYWKAQRIAETAKTTEQGAMAALVEYQHSQEV